MKSRVLLVALVAACGVDGAIAQAPPDGYHCTVAAFSILGGLDAVGIGEVTLRADAAYNPTGASFEYLVRDRVSHLLRMSATWNMVDGLQDGLGPIQSLRFPFHFGLAATPGSISFSLDGAAAAPGATQLSATRGLETAPDGRFRRSGCGRRTAAFQRCAAIARSALQ